MFCFVNNVISNINHSLSGDVCVNNTNTEGAVSVSLCVNNTNTEGALSGCVCVHILNKAPILSLWLLLCQQKVMPSL